MALIGSTMEAWYSSRRWLTKCRLCDAAFLESNWVIQKVEIKTLMIWRFPKKSTKLIPVHRIRSGYSLSKKSLVIRWTLIIYTRHQKIEAKTETMMMMMICTPFHRRTSVVSTARLGIRAACADVGLHAVAVVSSKLLCRISLGASSNDKKQSNSDTSRMNRRKQIRGSERQIECYGLWKAS